MKKANKLIALLLACLIFSSAVVLAADEQPNTYNVTPEYRDRLYNDAVKAVEAGECNPGYVLLSMNTVIGEDEIAGNLPELNELDVDSTHIIDGGDHSFVLIKLVDESSKAVKKAMELLKDNPNVAFVYIDTRDNLDDEQVILPPKDEWLGPIVEEEWYEDVYEPNISRRRERIAQDKGVWPVNTKKIEVHLQPDITIRSNYETLFPEIDTVRIEQTAKELYDHGLYKRQFLCLYFKDKSESDIWEIVESLEANPNVYFVAPSFIYSTGVYVLPVTMPDLTVPGDVTGEGNVDNRDLIMLARFVVNLIDFDENQFAAADMNKDGTVDNTDLITIARTVVGITPDDTLTLSE